MNLSLLFKFLFMKKLLVIALFVFIAGSANAQSKMSVADSTKKIVKVEASCGQCQFDMKAPGCSLAVRIDGKTYFVDGTKIDEHGDAHSKDGFCEAIRKAEVQGEVADNRFKATYFKLLPVKKEEAATDASKSSHH
jgi:hypothetical protein